MTASVHFWREQLDREGFTLLANVFAQDRVAELTNELTGALRDCAAEAAIRAESGTVYAARNILEWWPAAATIWRQPLLLEALATLLGPEFGLVRALFFDKPPDQSWSLPWHKDLTIAVQDNRLPSVSFSHPTRKADVPHVEAPCSLLEQMLTARIHCDDVTEENGPLKVVPGSHTTGKVLQLGDALPKSVLCRRGDVLLMRPLLAHSSGKSAPDTNRHRRILHLEFAATEQLPDGYRWHTFIR